jgi:hypothetical protein
MSGLCQNPACGKPLPPRKAPGRARKWCCDRCRKSQYAGVCVDCGGPTEGIASGYAKATTRCRACDEEMRHATRKWTPETVVETIRRWAVEHDGTPPSATDWLYSASGGVWPSVAAVQREFGTWNKAIAAAGFTPRRVGHRGPSRRKVVT